MICSEKVKIPKEKPFIILKGQSRRTTEIVWGDHENLAQSPTFTSLADNVVIKSISFRVRFLLLLSYVDDTNDQPFVFKLRFEFCFTK